jgi:cyclopropane fatty-acyl-phospholipid synthase-like methyltransferase
MQSFANENVLEFYKALPFNYYESTEKQARSVENGRRNIEANVPLAQLLPATKRVLDVGCGAGWLSNSISKHFGCDVVGIDFNPVAVERARATAAHLALGSKFLCHDLFTFMPDQKFDLAVSLGVLHHTDNCIAAIRHIVRNFVKPGGYFYLGLYHTFGRRPFLEHFEKMKAAGKAESTMLEEYRRLHSTLSDQTHVESWFRDQVIHPHETQHSFEEISKVFSEEGVQIVSTSINRFGPIDSIESLCLEERKYEEVSHQALKDGRYFPGFFTVMGQLRI